MYIMQHDTVFYQHKILTTHTAVKRQYELDRTARNNKAQRINCLENPYLLGDQSDTDNWEKVSEIAVQDMQEVPQTEELVDQMNFLEVDPSCPL